jgi:hypothetical protein
MESIGYNLSSWFAPEGRRFVKRRVARQQRRRGRVVPQRMSREELSDEHLEWSDEQCEGCWWCHPRTRSDFVKFNEWLASNGDPPVEIPSDVEEDVLTVWDDQQTERFLQRDLDWRGLKVAGLNI